MDQMNVSITDRLAGYVRKKVKSGRYNNASEVVRDALRRMEDEDTRAVRLAIPSAEDIVSDLNRSKAFGIVSGPASSQSMRVNTRNMRGAKG
jgi:antitoxin ParD1/3/4